MNKKDFVTILGQLRPSSTFLSVIGYCNEYNEVANYSLLFNVNYNNALMKSIEKLESIESDNDIVIQAKNELIKSFSNSLKKFSEVPEEEYDDGTYTRFFDEDGNCIKGIKVHSKTNVLHLYGFVQHKRVLMPGIYPSSNKKELTKAKDKLRKQCPIGKFRQFKMLPSQVDYISVDKMKLSAPTF